MHPDHIKNILIVGSGVMGSSIAQVFATAGIFVRLVDVEQKALDRAERLIESGLDTLAAYGTVSKNDIPTIMERIKPSIDLPRMSANADFVIEAVPEVPQVKKEIFSQLERNCPAEAVIASNTSGLNIFNIGEFQHPERFLIAHFFAPAHIIPLVEIVPGPQTSVQAIALTRALMEKAKKSPIVLKEFIPSFIVNRIANAIGKSVTEMLDNGWAAPEDIDLAVKLSWGIRLPIVGVVQTADFNGLDIICDIFKSIGFESPFYSNLVQQGRLGVKTARGIYDYSGRSEEEILRKRDERFLSMLDHMKKINAFEPI